jgi:hypothetical protein
MGGRTVYHVDMETNTTTKQSLVDTVRLVFPDAYPLWVGPGAPDPDSAVIDWSDHRLIVSSIEHEGYDVGLYDKGDDSYIPIAFASFADMEKALGAVCGLIDVAEIDAIRESGWGVWAANKIECHPDQIQPEYRV